MEEKKKLKLYVIAGILILIIVITALLVIFRNNKPTNKESSGMIAEVSITSDDEAEIIEIIKKNVVKIENKLENNSIIGTGFFHKTGI